MRIGMTPRKTIHWWFLLREPMPGFIQPHSLLIAPASGALSGGRGTAAQRFRAGSSQPPQRVLRAVTGRGRRGRGVCLGLTGPPPKSTALFSKMHPVAPDETSFEQED